MDPSYPSVTYGFTGKLLKSWALLFVSAVIWVRLIRFMLLGIVASHYLAVLFCVAVKHVVLISAGRLLREVSVYILGPDSNSLTQNFTMGKSIDFVELFLLHVGVDEVRINPAQGIYTNFLLAAFRTSLCFNSLVLFHNAAFKHNQT